MSRTAFYFPSNFFFVSIQIDCNNVYSPNSLRLCIICFNVHVRDVAVMARLNVFRFNASNSSDLVGRGGGRMKSKSYRVCKSCKSYLCSMAYALYGVATVVERKIYSLAHQQRKMECNERHFSQFLLSLLFVTVFY